MKSKNKSMVLMVLMMLAILSACGKKQEPLRAPSDEKTSTIQIETAYGPLHFPEELSDNMRHMEVTEDNTAMEVFYMVTQEGEKEVFRFHFADVDMGTFMGYLIVDGIEVSVSYSLCEYADEDFANEEERKLYYSMMDAFSMIMNSIYADERFSETRAMAPVGEKEASLRYWEVTLPANVQYEEMEENGTYRVDFFGVVSGERIDLYTIALGEMEAETTLGMYTVNGMQKPVKIQTYSLERYATWGEENQTVISLMMNTINDVIDAIMQSKHFSAEAE